MISWLILQKCLMTLYPIQISKKLNKQTLVTIPLLWDTIANSFKCPDLRGVFISDMLMLTSVGGLETANNKDNSYCVSSVIGNTKINKKFEINNCNGGKNLPRV